MVENCQQLILASVPPLCFVVRSCEHLLHVLRQQFSVALSPLRVHPGGTESEFLTIFLSFWFLICGRWGGQILRKKTVNQSAASAASPDSVEFQAVIKSAATAAPRKPRSREGRSRGVQDGGSAGGRRPRGTPLELPSLDLGFLEAALAAGLITD